MIYPNNPLYLLSLLGYIYYLTYYTLTTKDNIVFLLSDHRIVYKIDVLHPRNVENGEYMRILRFVDYKISTDFLFNLYHNITINHIVS